MGSSAWSALRARDDGRGAALRRRTGTVFGGDAARERLACRQARSGRRECWSNVEAMKPISEGRQEVFGFVPRGECRTRSSRCDMRLAKRTRHENIAACVRFTGRSLTRIGVHRPRSSETTYKTLSRSERMPGGAQSNEHPHSPPLNASLPPPRRHIPGYLFSLLAQTPKRRTLSVVCPDIASRVHFGTSPPRRPLVGGPKTRRRPNFRRQMARTAVPMRSRRSQRRGRGGRVGLRLVLARSLSRLCRCCSALHRDSPTSRYERGVE